MAANCRNCDSILRCEGIWWKYLECPDCGYIYEHRFKKHPTHDELLEEYAKEPWNKRINYGNNEK